MEPNLCVNGGGGEIDSDALPADWALECWNVLSLHVLVKCPYFHQAPNSCAASALAMLLSWAGAPGCEHESVLLVWKGMGGSSDSFSAGDGEFIWKFCRERQIVHEHGSGTIDKLKEYVNHGIPVYVLSRAWIDNPLGHARVVVGYDETKSELIFHDPHCGPNISISYQVFDSIWGSFCWYNDNRRLFFVVKKSEGGGGA
jgi:hypothetical protein